MEKVYTCPLCGNVCKKPAPLSELDLRKLEGKPVWVVCGEEYNNARKWEIVNFGHAMRYGVSNSKFPFAHAPMLVADLGKTWNAYAFEF